MTQTIAQLIERIVVLPSTTFFPRSEMIALLGGRRSIYYLPKTAVLDKCSSADVQGQLMSGSGVIARWGPLHTMAIL